MVRRVPHPVTAINFFPRYPAARVAAALGYQQKPDERHIPPWISYESATTPPAAEK